MEFSMESDGKVFLGGGREKVLVVKFGGLVENL